MKPRSPEWYADWIESMDSSPSEVPADELLHLLRSALALAELEEWLRERPAARFVECLAATMDEDGGLHDYSAELTPNDGNTIIFGRGPDLLTAIEAALARAKDGGA